MRSLESRRAKIGFLGKYPEKISAVDFGMTDYT
jgi:hypothetical protein